MDRLFDGAALGTSDGAACTVGSDDSRTEGITDGAFVVAAVEGEPEGAEEVVREGSDDCRTEGKSDGTFEVAATDGTADGDKEVALTDGSDDC
jgi:hypothetical protein